MTFKYCEKVLNSKSRFATPKHPRCNDELGHSGKCSEFPFLEDLKSVAPKVADKVQRDAIMTTGAPWKSEEAGPNRILRYAMLLTDDELIALGIPMNTIDAGVIQKIRAKAAPYTDCIRVAEYLTLQVYGMQGAPEIPKKIQNRLERALGSELKINQTSCLICKMLMPFELFELARRGKAEIETAHAFPRIHQPGNVGFAHRSCNIAQGDKDLNEFYTWISGILTRNNWAITPPRS